MFMKFPQCNAQSSFRTTVHKITSSKLILFYVCFSLLYSVVQTALSARGFFDFSGAIDTFAEIATLGNAHNRSIPIYDGTQLALCASERTEANYHCNIVWDGTPKVNTFAVAGSITPRGGQFTNSSVSVPITLNGIDMELDESCLFSLNFPIFEIYHAKRESVVFLCFQACVFIISMIAVTNESIPHIFASLLTHVFICGWSIFQIVHCMNFQKDYREIIMEGACNGVESVLPDFYNIRRRTEIPIAVINFLALLVSALLSLKLIRILNWRNFRKAGANLQMNRHRKIMLALFIDIQLAVFFIIIFGALILDLLVKGNLRVSASFPVLYKTSAILSICVTLPWMISGWYAVQYERRIWTFLFLAWSLIWLSWFCSMFFSTSFTQEFIHWPFLASWGIVAAISSAVAFFLGVMCRFNYGKGYLPAKQVNPNSPIIRNSTQKTPAYVWDVENSPYSGKYEDEEKVEFPCSSNRRGGDLLAQFTFSASSASASASAHPGLPRVLPQARSKYVNHQAGLGLFGSRGVQRSVSEGSSGSSHEAHTVPTTAPPSYHSHSPVITTTTPSYGSRMTTVTAGSTPFV